MSTQVISAEKVSQTTPEEKKLFIEPVSFKYGKVEVPPAPQLIDSIRHSSHNFTTAIGDIVDNAVDVNATEVFILTKKEDGKSRLIIADNGSGMDPDGLKEAFTLGATNKLKRQKKTGRFGLGLKTAAGYIGDKLTVLTKTEDGIIIKGEHFFENILKDGWFVNIVVATPSEDKLFKDCVGDSISGTVIIIDDMRIENIYQARDSISPYLGRTFRYFLSPKSTRTEEDKVSGIVNMYIGSSRSTAIPVYGLDPLELQLVSNGNAGGTKLVLDTDMEVVQNGQKKYFSIKAVALDSADLKKNFNFSPSTKYQGIYYVRENREIEFASKKHDLWLVANPSYNYFRVEIRYSDMDDIFQLDHTKTHVEKIQQDVRDKIHFVLKPYFDQAAKRYGKNTKANTTDRMKKVHKKASENISNRRSALEFPDANKHFRSGKKNPGSGTVKSKNTGSKHKTGAKVNVVKKTKDCVFKQANFTSAGPLFEYEKENEQIVVIWNVSHPFYRKFVMDTSEREDGDGVNESLLLSLEYMAFSLSSAFLKYLQETNEEGDLYSENIMESISRNLRSLSN